MNDEIKVDGVTYRQRYNTCNKPDCKCQRGEKHGPYWYARDRMGSLKYVGTQLPEEVTQYLELRRSNRKSLAALKVKIIKRRDDAHRIYLRAQQELRTVQALESGEHCDSEMLASLGLSKFNGHKE